MVASSEESRNFGFVGTASGAFSYLRECFMNGLDVSSEIPQGLKPLLIKDLFGTTEVVP
jgi:hypothetical protein